MPRTDHASRVVNAPLADVFNALVDRDALLVWLPPEGMSGTFEHFDPKPGGSYRLVLTYAGPTAGSGKSSADSDVVEVRYLDIVVDDRVVQAVDFVSDDPSFAGTMSLIWEVRRVDPGTRIDITAGDVPDGISPESHASGLNSSLANLARYLES